MSEKMNLKGQNRKSRFSRKMTPYCFLAPVILLFVVFLLYPILHVLYYSFQNYNPGAFYGNGFAGFGNYIKIFTKDRNFSNAMVVSLQWIVSEISLQLLFGLIIALLLNTKFRGRGLARGIMFAPWALSGVIVSILWALLYNEHVGLFNDLLIRLEIIKTPIAWMGNLNTVFPAIVLAELWRGIPFFAISLLAALQNVPVELYESCAMDGGGAFRRFFSITLPYLKDTIVMTTLLRSVWEFNSVDLILSLTGGGPVNRTTTLSVYLANLAIKNQEFGYGSAIAIVSFLIMLIFAFTYLSLSKFGEEDL